MRRPLFLAFAATAAALALVPLAVVAETPPPTPAASAPPQTAEPATVTATGEATVPVPANPLSVYMVQLQGSIDQKDPNASVDAYVAKLERIRQAVIGAGVPAASVTAASYSTNPLGASPTVGFNSVFRYEVRPDAVSVAAAQAAFAAGATMVYNNMPASAVGVRRPDDAALDAAITQATAQARGYASKAVAGRSVGEARATTISVKGEPETAAVGWRVEVTVTFAVR
jgi:hypothetical protein